MEVIDLLTRLTYYSAATASGAIDKKSRTKFFKKAPEPRERPVFVKPKPKFLTGKELAELLSQKLG